MDLTPKQQTSEAVRQAETIIITTGQHPSIDQVAAVLALAAILRKFGKKVTAIITDPIPQQLGFLDNTGLDRNLSGLRDFILKVDVTKTEVDKLRYEVEGGKLNIYITPFKGGYAPSDVTFDYGDFHYDLAIILGVPTKSRIDTVYEKNPTLFDSIPLVNLDFHRSNEGYGAINLIEGTASSLCEILIALSESLQTGLIDADIATIMLTGLMAATDRFTASHTTSKSLTVAAQMMAAGARQPSVVQGLYRDGKTVRTERSDRPKVDAQPRRDAPSSVSQPAAVPNPAEAAEVAPMAHIPAEPALEPIIEPSHIEMSIPEDDNMDVASSESPMRMADFSAAAEILAQRQIESDSIEDVSK